MSKAKGKGDWKQIQQRTFTNWFNDRLRGNLKVAKRQADDVQTDLQDGILLIELLNILARPRKISRYSKNPKNKVHCMENLNSALSFIEKEGIKLVNIGKSLLLLHPSPLTICCPQAQRISMMETSS